MPPAGRRVSMSVFPIKILLGAYGSRDAGSAFSPVVDSANGVDLELRVVAIATGPSVPRHRSSRQTKDSLR